MTSTGMGKDSGGRDDRTNQHVLRAMEPAMPKLFPHAVTKLPKKTAHEAMTMNVEMGGRNPCGRFSRKPRRRRRELEMNPFERMVVSASYVPDICIGLPAADADSDSEREKRINSERPPCIARCFDLSASFHCRIA